MVLNIIHMITYSAISNYFLDCLKAHWENQGSLTKLTALNITLENPIFLYFK